MTETGCDLNDSRRQGFDELWESEFSIVSMSELSVVTPSPGVD